MVRYESRKNVGMDYAEIKAFESKVLKSITMVVHAAKHLSQLDMMYVQRLFPSGEVKPQAYGGRKIRLF